MEKKDRRKKAKDKKGEKNRKRENGKMCKIREGKMVKLWGKANDKKEIQNGQKKKTK